MPALRPGPGAGPRKSHVAGLAAALAVLAVTAWAPQALAAPLTPGNVLAASEGRLIEYTTAGAPVQTINVPLEGGGGIRDLAVDRFGNVQIYNGTFAPLLTQYDPRTGVFTHQPSAFSTVNNLTYGGIAAAGDYVFVTDMNTNNSPGRGLVRYRIGGGPTVTVQPLLEYIDVTFGLDGRLYALRGDSPNAGGGGVDVYDPVTTQSLGFVQLPFEVRAIAVDRRGDIFAVGTSAPITHFDRTGKVVKTLADPIGGMGDIDLDDNGRLVVASHSGAVGFTTTALDSLTSFNYRHRTDLNFVAWTDPADVVPTRRGDVNADGRVDANDLLLVRRNLGGEDGPWDVTADGRVNALDLRLVREEMRRAGVSPALVSVLPEPSPLMLLAAAGGWALLRPATRSRNMLQAPTSA
jgi:hypothetical protein